jgi:hypothetical protein
LRLFLSLVTVAIALFVSGPVAAADLVKTFPDYRCRLSVPGPNWTWLPDNSLPNAMCVARSPDGTVLFLAVVPVPAGTVLDEKFVADFDPTQENPMVTARGGRLGTFRGLTSYDWFGRVGPTDTAVIRMVIANGFAYQVHLLGKADPVERRPDFEAILNGFEFTDPPTPPEPTDRGKALAYNIGKMIGYGLPVAIVVGLVIVGLRRKDRRRQDGTSDDREWIGDGPRSVPSGDQP